ncbi:MAG: ROK family protein [Chloroflexi bacterium]|nr:ROK family protein [Chloroflexota bacterium]
MSRVLLCIDFGGTQTRAAVIDEAGALLSRTQALTPSREGPDAVFAVITQAARAALAQSPRTDISAVGLSSPGPIVPSTGIAYNLPNIANWGAVPIGPRLAAEFGVPCYAGNDANLAALSEWRFGAGRGTAHLIYLTLSTGIGTGVISGGRLIEGKDGLAAEAGHVVIERDGPPCSCGNHGCVESLGAGWAIARSAEERLARGEPSVLQAERRHVSARLVAEAAAAGDALAAGVFRNAAVAIGIGIGNLITVFNPEIVVCGGGLTNAGELLFGPVRETALSRCWGPLGAGTRIVRAELGDNMGLLGALVYALSRGA